jgi:hypothetical protein
MEQVTVVHEFFRAMSKKHDVRVNDLNIHISDGTLYVSEYTPDERSEFRHLETFELTTIKTEP